MLAYAPLCPVPREEKWYIILADPLNNAVLTYTTVSLVEAEAAGLGAWEKHQRKSADSRGLKEHAEAEPLANGKPSTQGGALLLEQELRALQVAL